MRKEHPTGTRRELRSDAVAIEYGIDQADREQRQIDDATARRVALSLCKGDSSPFYVLGSSGAIERDEIRREFMTHMRDGTDEQGVRWLGALFTYVLHHEDRPPQEGWHLLTADDKPVVGWLPAGDDG